MLPRYCGEVVGCWWRVIPARAGILLCFMIMAWGFHTNSGDFFTYLYYSLTNLGCFFTYLHYFLTYLLHFFTYLHYFLTYLGRFFTYSHYFLTFQLHFFTYSHYFLTHLLLSTYERKSLTFSGA